MEVRISMAVVPQFYSSGNEEALLELQYEVGGLTTAKFAEGEVELDSMHLRKLRRSIEAFERLSQDLDSWIS